MAYNKRIQKTKLFLEIDKIANEWLPQIEANSAKELKRLVAKNNFPHRLEIQVSRWGISVDFEDYEWSYKTGIPHYLHGEIHIDGVEAQQRLHISLRFANSFDDTADISIHIDFLESQLNNDDFVAKIKNEVSSFFEQLAELFLVEIQKINFDELGYLEDDDQDSK